MTVCSPEWVCHGSSFHLPLGKRRLRWVAQQLGHCGLDVLGNFAVGLPLVAQHLAGCSGLGVAGGLGHDVTVSDDGRALLLGGFTQFVQRTCSGSLAS